MGFGMAARAGDKRAAGAEWWAGGGKCYRPEHPIWCGLCEALPVKRRRGRYGQGRAPQGAHTGQRQVARVSPAPGELHMLHMTRKLTAPRSSQLAVPGAPVEQPHEWVRWRQHHGRAAPESAIQLGARDPQPLKHVLARLDGLWGGKRRNAGEGGDAVI